MFTNSKRQVRRRQTGNRNAAFAGRMLLHANGASLATRFFRIWCSWRANWNATKTR